MSEMGKAITMLIIGAGVIGYLVIRTIEVIVTHIGVAITWH